MHIKCAFNMKDLFTLNHDIHGDSLPHTFLHIYLSPVLLLCTVCYCYCCFLFGADSLENAIINKGIDNIYIEWKKSINENKIKIRNGMADWIGKDGVRSEMERNRIEK